MNPAEHNRALMMGPTLVRDTVLSLAVADGKLSWRAVWAGKTGWLGDMLQQSSTK